MISDTPVLPLALHPHPTNFFFSLPHFISLFIPRDTQVLERVAYNDGK